jgi:uncharacterized membrane protein YadS
MIAPMLIVLGIILSSIARKQGGEGSKVKLVIPWFAVYFIGVAGINSLIHAYTMTAPAQTADFIRHTITQVNIIDTFLLTMAMTALGMGTRFAKFKGLGLAPIYTAGGMFLWLVIGGFVITQAVVSLI